MSNAEGRRTIGTRAHGYRDDPKAHGAAAIAHSVRHHLVYVQGSLPEIATRNDWYMALSYTVRDRLIHRWIRTLEMLHKRDVKVVSYMSAEFLMGPHLANCLINLGIYDEVKEAIEEMGLSLDELIRQEEEPGLGNGGLGRLAACFLDSLATLEVPAIGYGIRYEFGIFDQVIRDGWQVEVTDKWLRFGNPWEIQRPEVSYNVNFGGHTEPYTDQEGRYRVRWIPDHVVKGIAYDTPVPGYRVATANLLRLWRAEAVESFDFQAFNVGDYYKAVEDKVDSENITKVLYPNDEPLQGRRLRLKQQYFFVSCSLQDMLRIHLRAGNSLRTFNTWWAVQLNDTHPSIAIAELMRLLVDEHLMAWEEAWDITQKTFAYTNHTLLPEALEKWPLPLFQDLLPRHIEIIYEINRRFLDEVRLRYQGDDARLSRLSLIDESHQKYVRMAHLACVGSHAVNGVARLHSQLLQRDVMRDFYELRPESFHNVTNGVTPRRWLLLSNPALARLITRKIGDRWIDHLETELVALEELAEEPEFQDEWRRIKRDNKLRLATLIKERTGIVIDPDSMYDIQVKRIHEYKRQHLNVLHVITLYNRLKKNPAADAAPRTVIFGGKAAPGYVVAKRIIKLIHSVAEVVNNDPEIAGRLRVVFFPDFNVKNAEHIYPAADLSEQISTAGYEASGTGNMKFSMNGALTIGTLDGANVEIREAVGDENFFLFGLTADGVAGLKASGYSPAAYYENNELLREVIEQIRSGVFSSGDRDLFGPLVDSLLYRDQYVLFADYQSYVDCQETVSRAYGDQQLWTRIAILNVARIGRFSSDRSIRDYCQQIWDVNPVRVRMDDSL
ncbi:MAG: glycogen/starch/alpha-glucan phosphorylase [Acidobacteriota bacterium]